MIKRSYSLQLATPAFLGGADQRAEWRTPPFKALIREWWRIAVAPDVGFSFSRLKERETELFGTAADEGGGENHKSSIRLALKHWHNGTLTDWAKINPPERGKPGSDPQVKHREVQFGNGMVGSQLYLGYGPLILDRGNPAPKLKNNGAALQADEHNILSLAFPDIHVDGMSMALTLANWFGTIGGRSRNGWGSISWASLGGTSELPPLTNATLAQTGCVRPLAHCLELDWPHAIGRDDKGALVWRGTNTFANWRDAMKFLAQVKIGFRTELGFTTGDNSTRVEPRHIVAYPVTKHHVGSWGRNVRIANTLRFKITTEADGGLRALIYHTPCRPTLRHDGVTPLTDTWQPVHRMLDRNPQLTRLS